MSALPCHSQDIKPRRRSHLPLDANFGGVAYTHTEGDEFINGKKHEEDPLFIGQGRLIHTFTLGGSLQW